MLSVLHNLPIDFLLPAPAFDGALFWLGAEDEVGSAPADVLVELELVLDLGDNMFNFPGVEAVFGFVEDILFNFLPDK